MHKLVHKKRDEKMESGYKYTGPLRPFPYSFTGRREVPDHIIKPGYAKNAQGEPNKDFQALRDSKPPVVEGD